MDEDEDASMMSVDDISSSTDPLLETAATPASRSVTPAIPARQPASARRGSRRNQQPTPRTQRVQALRESTPRKRMFELDVGDARSPQRLLVTVEAESSRVTSRSSVSRRLFQHSTPTARSIRERERTTSVTVPLRGVEGDDDDEITRLGEFVTPRPRGRPPRTATPGTALRSETPKTTTRPMRPATPGFQLREARSSSKDVLDSDVTIDFSKLGFTPGTKRRISLTPGPSSRAPKRRKGVSSPVRQPSLLGPGSARRKRGRPRKDSIAHDQFSALIDRDLTALKEDDSDHEPGPEAESSRDQQDRNRGRDQNQEHTRREHIFQRVPSNVILGNTGVGAPSSDAPGPDESEGDLWLDNSFNPPQDTPAARRWNGAPRAQSSRVEQLRPEPARQQTPQLESELSHGDEYVEFADFGGGESHSDIESGLEDDNATPRDTPVQPTETRLPGEEFTMIDPYSLLSMQQNSSYVEEQGHGGAQNKDTRDGDTTSFYISKTIGSLRISQQESDERSSHIRTIDYSVNPNWTTTPRAPVPSYDPLYRYSTGDNRGEAEVVEEEEEEGDAHERSESLERHQNRPYPGAEQDSEREEQDRDSRRDSQRDRELESELALEPGSDAGSEPKVDSRSERGKEAESQHEPALEPEESDIWFQKEPRRRQQRELRKGKTHEPEPEPEPEPASEFNTWVRAEQRQEHQYRTQLESSLLHQRQANRTSRLERERELELEQIAGNTPDFEPLPEQRSESLQEPEREPVSEPHLEEEQEQEQELEDNLEYERQQESEAEARQEQAQQPQSRRVKSPHQQKARSLERQLDVDVRGDVGVDSSNRSVDYDQCEIQESSVLYHGHLRRESRGALPPEPSSPLFRKSQTDVQHQTTKTSIQPSVERPSSVNNTLPLHASNSILTPDKTPSPVPPEPRDYDFQDDFGTHANVEADIDDAELNDDEQRQPTESTEPTPDDEMPSSPPTGSFSRHEQQRPEPPLCRVRSNSNETPADRLTSLAPPGLPALNPQNLMPPPDSQNRPALSPIIRAGEALQQVTSDPPSPPGMGSFLRSPFRGVPEVKDSRSPSPSASRASQLQPQSQPQAQPQSQPLPQAQFENARNQPERSGFGLFGSIKNLVAQGAQVLSPRNASRQASINTGESSRQASATAGATSSMDIAMDDPFGPDPPGSSRGSTGRNSLFGSRMSKRDSGSQDASGTASASASFEKQSQASASLERQSRASSSSDRQAHGYNGFGRQFEGNAGFDRWSQVNAGTGSQRQVFGEPYAQGSTAGFERSAQADANLGGRSQANTSFDRQADASTSFGRSQVQASSSHAIKQPSVTTKFDRQRQANNSFEHQEAEASTTNDRQAQSETSFASQRQASTSSSTRQPQANPTFGSTKRAASSISEPEREREQREHEHEHEAMDWQAEESSHSHEINVTRDRSASASLGFHNSSSHHNSSGEREHTATREENSTRRSGSVQKDHDHREPSEPEAHRDYKKVVEVETVTEEREEERIWGSYGGDARARSSFRESSSNSDSGRRHGRPEHSTLRRSVGEEREQEREREPKARFRESVEVETVTEEREEERIYGGGDARSSSFRESSHSSRRHGHGRDGHRHGSSRHRSSEERETTREERERSEARERGRREVTEEIVEEVREEEYEHGSEHCHSGGRPSSGREEVESYRHGSSRSDRSDRGKASSSRQRSEERETREDRERREQGAREVTEEIMEEVREEYEHESEHYRWGGHGEENRRHGSSHSNRSDRGKASSSSSGERGHRQRSSGEREAREVREMTEEIVEEERHEYEEERGGRRSSHVEESHRHWSRGPRGSQSSRASDSRQNDHMRGLKERDTREVTEAEDERHEYEEERKGQHSGFVEESSQRQESHSGRGGDSWRRDHQRSSAKPKRRESEEARDDFAKEGQEHRASRGSETSRQRESLLGRGKTSSRSDQLRGLGEAQATEVERARHDDFTEREYYNTPHAEESHQREESPLEHRRDEHEHEHEQDHREDYMEEEEEGHHQAQQGEQAREQHEEEEEEEEDLFLLEAMRSSPAVKAKSTLKENDPASFLPSTHQLQPSSRWHSNKSQMVRDQLNTAADKSDELEEFSLLHSSRAKKFRPALKPVPNKKANLSSFFSSPAPIPEISLQGPEGNASLRPGPEVLDRQSQANGKVSSGPGALSERSQTLPTGQEAERKLGTTPTGRVPSSQRLSVPVSQKPFQPSPLGTAPVLSGQSSRPLQPAQRVLRHSSSIIGSSSPPQSGSIYTPVPQKQNFTPVRREPGAKLPLFERGGGTKPSTVTTLPLKDNDSGSGTTPNSITDKPKQLLFGLKESISKLFSDPPAKSVEYGPENDNEEEQEPEEDMDDYDEIVELEEEQSSTEESFEPPPLRTLPDKNSSPIKSALRPPTKGHTPGRAVQFANSVRQSPTPRRSADVQQRRPVFGGRSTPVIITSSPSTHTESSPVPSPAGSERIEENAPGGYEEDYQDEEQHELDDAADTDMDMDMDDDIEWYEHKPAPAPVVQAPRPAPPFPRPLSPGRGRQRQQQQQQELQPQQQQQQSQVAAAPRQPPAAQPPLIKPTSTLENSPVIRSGVSLFGYGRRKSLPPPIPPSNRNIVTPLQPLYPSLPPVSSFGQQQQQQKQSSQPSTSTSTLTSQHHNGQASTAASTAASTGTSTTTTSHHHQQEQHLPPPTHLWSTSHWDILSSVIHAHRALQSQSQSQSKGKGKQRAAAPTHLYYPHSPTLSSFLHQTYRPSPQQTTYDPVTRLPIDESVVIEQWHLDVVYEFREMFRRAWGTDELYGGVFAMDEQEKGGWSEGELVRRVYAFLVGERRRREGRVDRGRRRRGRGVVC
ncbi:hypothetical protein NEUTE1DRAFT_83603 [Neurospora tetrasperma FGSC 2508]|uniref:Uncharacterized protein n=1 Tax=Neurospora tetrasperma (strain FGSC 2508 / ATCC MYA-4615 / P0657) TaxID=510951 RepID=F8MPX6_NEUT8|nr:uncharacterized protein NEUTE1DRAFT_83603 [Neurospora tetrasperma FGSC 2508]EGO56406.1 hypothetical protein NEUTE1DRAFT_83603 [Neurospora tetrasperma FGSC 2508]